MQTKTNQHQSGRAGKEMPPSTGTSRVQSSWGEEKPLSAGASEGEQRQKSRPDDELKAMKPAELAEYITFHFHADMWKNMPVVHELLLSVVRTYGEEHEEVKEIHKLFGQLCTDVEGHLLDEEANFFPNLSKNDAKARKEREPEVEHLMKEHEETEKLFEKIRKEADDYTLPENADDAFRRLYAMLPQMEAETLEHYHVENDILFPEVASK